MGMSLNWASDRMKAHFILRSDNTAKAEGIIVFDTRYTLESGKVEDMFTQLAD